MPSAARLLAHGLAVLGGVAAGLLGSFVHGYTTYGVPLGLVVALALSAAVFAGAGLATSSRAGTALALAGWFLTVGLLAQARPEGDLVVPGTTLGYVWLAGGVVAGLAAVSRSYEPRGRG